MDKKILAISLIITMVICNSMTVWAADTWNGDTYIKGSGTDSSTTTNGTDSGTKTITGTFTKDSATTYEVNIIWGDLGYTYDGLISWNGSTYDGNDSKTNWSADMPLLSDIIDIQNLSDKKVKATFLLIENSDYISVDDSSLTATYTDLKYTTDGETDTVTEEPIDGNSITYGSNAIANSGEIGSTIRVSISGVPKGIVPVFDGNKLDLTNTGIPIANFTISLEGVS